MPATGQNWPGLITDFADALIKRNGRDGHVRAVELLDESLNIAGKRMRPLMKRVNSRRDILQAKVFAYCLPSSPWTERVKAAARIFIS